MADSVFPFKQFCDLCEGLKSAKQPDKEKKLHQFISDYKKLIKSDNKYTDSTFYPVLRLLVPQYERERGPYGLKETTFARVLKNALPISNVHAHDLQQYRLNLAGTTSKDFADVAYWVLRNYCVKTSTLTIAQVNEYLDGLATKHSEHKPREVEDDVFNMVEQSTAEDQKWMIRIILKDMKLGLGNDRILNIFHPDASDLFNVCNDLSEVCKRLQRSNVRLHELEVNLFTPFRPMLCHRCDRDVINKVMKDNKTYYVENKFDGERFQMHMKDGVFDYFSKNGYKYTNIYGADYSSGLITPYLKELFKDVRSVIFDGEMMGWNTKTNTFGSKGMNYDVKMLKASSVHRPCYCVFDILLYNGTVLTNKPLSERLKILGNVVKPIEGVIKKSAYVEVNSKQALLDELNKTVDKDDEGICFKDPDSVYKPNNRNAGWWKMKLEYFEGLMTELDLLIIGACYGDGGSVGKINSFLLGVGVTSDDSGTPPSTFYSFAKVASGLTAVDYKKLMQKIGPHLQKVGDNDGSRAGIVWTKEKPDVWIEPRHSVILQVRASELTRSKEFKTDYTLRFPRVEKLRDDKPWYNCLSLSELNKLTTSSKAVEKLNGRHIRLSDVEEIPKKRRKKTQNAPELVDENEIDKLTNCLKGLEFNVLTGNERFTKLDIEKKIYENGGTVVQIAGAKTYCILMGDSSPIISLLKTCNEHDVVKLDSFLHNIEVCETPNWIPDDFIVISENTKLKLSANYDKYGDSYTKPIKSKSALDKIMKNIDDTGDYLNLMPQEMINFDKLLGITNPLALFRMCIAYFDKFSVVGDNSTEKSTELQQVEYDFQFFGGTSSKTIDCETTHVIIHSSDLSRLVDITRVVSQENLGIKIVTESWVCDCLNKKETAPESLYSLK